MIKIFHGPVMASKSFWLISELESLMPGSYQAIRPRMDDRDAEGFLHSRASIARIPCQHMSPRELWRWMDQAPPEIKTLAIDEAHMMGEPLIHLVRKASEKFQDVILSGLDRDWKGHLFPGMRDLLEEPAISKGLISMQLSASCSICGASALWSQKTGGSQEAIHEPGHHYEPRCKKHFMSGKIDGRNR